MGAPIMLRSAMWRTAGAVVCLIALAGLHTGTACAFKQPRSLKCAQPVQEYFFSFAEDTRMVDGKPVDFNPFRFYTHLGTDYGRIGPGESCLSWQPHRITADLRYAGWAGMWHSLAGLARESERALDFTQCYPYFIRSQYQPRCVGMTVVTSGTGLLKLELKSPAPEHVLWQTTVRLKGGKKPTTLAYSWKPENLRRVKFLNWVAESGSNLSVDTIQLNLEIADMPFATRVFLFSYAKLAPCYSSTDGAVKDRANFPIGDFDSVPASGLFCLATCAAWRMGIVDQAFAAQALRQVHQTVSNLPRAYGLLPHFIRKYDGQYRIHAGTEYSTGDTSLYYHSMLLAAQMLSDNQTLANLTGDIQEIEFEHLRDPDGWILHGIKDDGTTELSSTWRDWGGETAMAILLECMAAGEDARLRMDGSGKVFRGIGFIAEIQSLFYPHFSQPIPDAVSGVNWLTARRDLLTAQMAYFPRTSPAARLGIFGVSAGEGFHGVGYAAEGTETIPKTNLIHPHYMLMSAPLQARPESIYTVLQNMETCRNNGLPYGLFPPWGVPENLTTDLTEYLPMLGSLNASFECLGAYHLWAKTTKQPDRIYEAAMNCPILRTAIQAFYPQGP